MFSQRDEEKWILEFFGKAKGRFLDIGAYDGKTFSNTRQLALNGWGGVLVEPCPSVHKVLDSMYGSDERFQIVKVGIGLKQGVIPFYNFCGDAVGSFDIEHAKLWEEKGKRKYTVIQLPVITVANLVAQIGIDFEFINIDTEGWSFDVLRSLPFMSMSKVKMICVEFDGQPQRIIDLLGCYGFEKLRQTAENLLMVKK